MEETIKEVVQIVQRGIPTQHVVINASKINLMQQDNHLTEIVNSCPLINADGSSIVWACKQFGIPLKERVTGIDLFLNLISLANEKGFRVYLFGAEENVVRQVRNIFQNQFPNLQIVGFRNGYFSPEDESEIVQNISNSNADMLFVAFSSPKKEYWINKYLDQLNVPFVMGVGGSFDVVAGKTKRAPLFMQKIGMEWFYRFIQEPKRLFQRYILGNIKFVFTTIRYKNLKRYEND